MRQSYGPPAPKPPGSDNWWKEFTEANPGNNSPQDFDKFQRAKLTQLGWNIPPSMGPAAATPPGSPLTGTPEWQALQAKRLAEWKNTSAQPGPRSGSDEINALEEKRLWAENPQRLAEWRQKYGVPMNNELVQPAPPTALGAPTPYTGINQPAPDCMTGLSQLFGGGDAIPTQSLNPLAGGPTGTYGRQTNPAAMALSQANMANGLSADPNLLAGNLSAQAPAWTPPKFLGDWQRPTGYQPQAATAGASGIGSVAGGLAPGQLGAQPTATASVGSGNQGNGLAQAQADQTRAANAPSTTGWRAGATPEWLQNDLKKRQGIGATNRWGTTPRPFQGPMGPPQAQGGSSAGAAGQATGQAPSLPPAYIKPNRNLGLLER